MIKDRFQFGGCTTWRRGGTTDLQERAPGHGSLPARNCALIPNRSRINTAELGVRAGNFGVRRQKNLASRRYGR